MTTPQGGWVPRGTRLTPSAAAGVMNSIATEDYSNTQPFDQFCWGAYRSLHGNTCYLLAALPYGGGVAFVFSRGVLPKYMHIVLGRQFVLSVFFVVFCVTCNQIYYYY